MNRRTAVLSMDVEDWYHLAYFPPQRSARWSMLDGLDVFAEFLERRGLPATFFCLGDLLPPLKERLLQLRSAGNEIASHGPDHNLPTQLSEREFVDQMVAHKAY